MKKSEVIKLMKEGYKIFVDCVDKIDLLYSIFKETGYYNPHTAEVGFCYYLNESLPRMIVCSRYMNNHKIINLSKIEPDNEKPYLFYEGEKYYFGEEYEFSDDKTNWIKSVLESYVHSSKTPFCYPYIRKIDHTAKYKKLLLELKEQAEKDGVNLKELI